MLRRSFPRPDRAPVEQGRNRRRPAPGRTLSQKRLGSWSTSSVFRWLQLQVVEIGLRVRLGPDADFAGVHDGVVGRLQHFFAVEVTLDGLVHMLHLDDVPLIGRYLEPSP